LRKECSARLAALLCSAAFVATAAVAQPKDPGDRPGPATQPANGARTDAVIDTIVVTARRKEEALTSVPASITAYSSDYLQKHNVTTFIDYATKVPNLTFQYGQGGSLLWSGSRQTAIRGVAGSGVTAFYVNDTPVPASVSPQTLNLDRIEVLKGPQGTLFGASSMGGNLRYITKTPSLSETDGTLQVQGGGTRAGGLDFDGDAQANIVLAPDRVALDLAGGYTRDSGFITRRFPDAAGNLVSRSGQGRNDVTSGSATLRTKLTGSLEMTVMALGEIADLHGFPAAYAHLPAYVPISLTVDRDRDVQEYAKDRWGIGSVVFNYQATGFSVVFSTSYFARRIEEKEDDTEGSNLFLAQQGVDLGEPAFATLSFQKERRFTQEARLSFDEGAILPGLSGIVGVYYQHTHDDTRVPGQRVQALADAGLDPPYLGSSTLIQKSDDTALFGELYDQIAPKLTLTLGLRRYLIKQSTAPTTDTGFIIGPDGAFQPRLSSRQSGLAPKAVLSYKLGEQGAVYASVSKGFRPGGSQQRLPEICSADLARLGLTIDKVGQFKSDTLWSYEVGAKGQFADRRLSASAAAFQIDWSGIQESVLLPGCTVSFTGNAGKARIRGGEMELSGRPVEDVPFTLQFGVGYTEATLLDPGYLPQAPGSRLPQVPRWTASISGYYERPLTQSADLFVAADYSYTSVVKVSDGAGGFYDRQPLDILNGDIGVRFGRSQILLYGKNLLDKRLNLGDQPSSGFERQDLVDGNFQRLPRVVVSRPRQIGVQLRQEF